jgi:cytidine deaminase
MTTYTRAVPGVNIHAPAEPKQPKIKYCGECKQFINECATGYGTCIMHPKEKHCGDKCDYLG